MGELQKELQRLSSTTLDATGAANAWAGTTGLGLIGALNTKAGILRPNWLGLAGVLNYLAGTTGLGINAAAALITGVPPVTNVGLKLPGTAGNYISTPDSVLNSITGDIDIRVCVKLIDWTPAAINTLISKWTTGTNNRSWRFRVDSGGTLTFEWSVDGATSVVKTSTVAVPFVDNTTGWVRAILDVDDGVGQSVVRFHTSVDGITWTQLGADRVTTGVTNIFDSTAIVELGTGIVGTSLPLNGTIYYAEVRNGIDGPVVVKFDASQVVSTGAMLPATINGWTWNGSTLYKRDDYVRLPGTAGNYLSFPDTAANSVTGDIDIRWHGSLDDWTPAAETGLVSKILSDSARSFLFTVTASGGLYLYLSADGSALPSVGSSVNMGSFVNGSAHWVRATWRASDGRVQFFTSEDGVTWTQLGTDVTIALASIYNGSGSLELSSFKAGTGGFNLAGNVYYAEVRNGINGPVVASFNAADNQVQTPWTINGTGWNWESSTFTGKPVTALQLPGTNGNYVSTPDTAGVSVVGDIDIRCLVALNDWTSPAADEQAVVAKWMGTGNQRSFALTVQPTSGVLRLYWSANGSTILSKNSTVAPTVLDGQTLRLRAALIVSTGQVSFFTSTDGVTWTPLGTLPSAAGATSVFDSTALLQIGSIDNGAFDAVAGKVYYAEVRNGIDGPIVAKFDATNIARTGTRTPTTTVQPGETPNHLTPNAASMETSTAGWAAGVNTTLTRETAQFLDGAASLGLNSTAIGATAASTTPVTQHPVVAGKSYTAVTSFRAAILGLAVSCQIDWYTAASGLISSTTPTAGTDTTVGWTALTNTGVAPATAAFAVITVKVTDVAQAAAALHYVERIALVESAAVWTMNGSAWDLVSV